MSDLAQHRIRSFCGEVNCNLDAASQFQEKALEVVGYLDARVWLYNRRRDYMALILFLQGNELTPQTTRSEIPKSSKTPQPSEMAAALTDLEGRQSRSVTLAECIMHVCERGSSPNFEAALSM